MDDPPPGQVQQARAVCMALRPLRARARRWAGGARNGAEAEAASASTEEAASRRALAIKETVCGAQHTEVALSGIVGPSSKNDVS